jgi:hypothetical protein
MSIKQSKAYHVIASLSLSVDVESYYLLSSKVGFCENRYGQFNVTHISNIDILEFIDDVKEFYQC